MLDSQIVLHDAYKLLCIFAADQKIFEMTDIDQRVYGGSKQSNEPLFRLHNQFLEDDIFHLLINLAIHNRTHLDWKKREHDQDWLDHSCGKLITCSNVSETETDLTFREACNKIIHATSLRTTIMVDQLVQLPVSERIEPIHDVIWVEGNKGKQDWKAQIKILEFLRATTKNFDLF